MTIGYLIPLWMGPALQLALVLVFLRHRIFLRTFPAFFSYNCFAVVAGIVAIMVLRRPFWHFWVYSIANVIYGVLALLVLREVAQTVFDMRRGWRRLVFWGSMLTLGAVATLWGRSHPDGPGHFAALSASGDAFMAGVHTAESVLFCIVLLMVRRFNQYQIGIMLGFTASAVVDILDYIAYYHPLPSKFDTVIAYAPVSAYIASAAIWLIMFLTKPKVGGKFDPDAARELMLQQTGLLREIATGLGLKPPDKKGKGTSGSEKSIGGTRMGQPAPRRV